MVSDDLLREIDRIETLPTLPAIAMKISAMLLDYDTPMCQLAQTIEKDQAIVPRILRLVNSAFFGVKSQISNIPEAIVLLGFNSVRNAVLTLSVVDMFDRGSALKDFSITEFWTHSVATAITSAYLAEQTHLCPPEDAFTAGLLHDIGKLLLTQYFQSQFEMIWMSSKKNSISFFEAEKRVSMTNHAEIGAYLSKGWKLPEGLIDAIRYHHSVEKPAGDFDLLLIIHAANIIVNAFKANPDNRIDLSGICSEAQEALRHLMDHVYDWFPELQSEIQEACQFFLPVNSPNLPVKE